MVEFDVELPFPVITGVGLVSPLGRTAEKTWRSLLDYGRITDHARVEPTAGRSHLPRVSALAVEAATEAVRQAGWSLNEPTGVVACTSKGPVESWLHPPAADPTSDNVGGGAASLHRYGFGMAGVAAAVADELRLGDGPRLTFSAACAGGLQGLVRAALLLRSGEATRVLVVAAEASVHDLFLASFRRLGVLPPPGELCRPFDERRSGFLMSEAAAAVCLENSCDDVSRLATMNYFATGGDATSLTGVDGRTLRHLLAAVVPSWGVQLVHAHGTGTVLNDAAELAALHAELPDGGAGCLLYSHKAALGHSLGASGLVSAVLNVLAHQWGEIPPNVNTMKRWRRRRACVRTRSNRSSPTASSSPPASAAALPSSGLTADVAAP